MTFNPIYVCGPWPPWEGLWLVIFGWAIPTVLSVTRHSMAEKSAVWRRTGLLMWLTSAIAIGLTFRWSGSPVPGWLAPVLNVVLVLALCCSVVATGAVLAYRRARSRA